MHTKEGIKRYGNIQSLIKTTLTELLIVNIGPGDLSTNFHTITKDAREVKCASSIAR